MAIPVAIAEINKLIEDVAAKKLFSINSSIKVKKYLLNKNEKKLIYGDNSIILTEKEIQLIELLLNKSKPITKDNILLSVWNYSTEADTHTVETHIYRLRKKLVINFLTKNLFSIIKMVIFYEKRNKIAVDLFSTKYRKRVVKPKRKRKF